ncbi:MAG: major capsid protein [Microviridae sp.]|nr:MAG: major capsid protein [Microviridae sp.]
MQFDAVKLVHEANQVQRKTRSPSHPHLIEHQPWQLQPFMIAPVLPGETLKNLNLQTRVITDPLVGGPGNLMPWWADHYYFYVKIRQLGDDVREAFEAMMLQGTPLGIVDAADAPTYHNGKSINWVKRCLTFVTEHGGFRNDGELASVAQIAGLPAVAAHRHGQSFLDSLTKDGALKTVNDLQDPQDPDVLEKFRVQYERMLDMRLIDMNFEDFLATYGVTLPKEALLDRPELIRMNSDWVYPANTVEPTTGVPTGAAMFSVNLKAEKSRFFNEPGFIFGVTCVRPKIFLGNQTGSAIQLMSQPFAFLPRILADQPQISIKDFLGGAEGVATGPLRNQTAGYWLDVGDLFRYGDQFIRYADAKGFRPALPAANGEKRWPTEAMATALFNVAANNKVRQDGVTRMSIVGHPQTTDDMT